MALYRSLAASLREMQGRRPPPGWHLPRASTSVSPHHHSARARNKLRHFLHPSGKRIHVANSPDEALRLREQLSRLHDEEEFDIYVSGTPEHLAAVRAARVYHEARREELRHEHGVLYERFADVHAELDALHAELERVTTQGVSLEAHFSKFGYNAHIKSYDDELFKMPAVRQYFHRGILWRGSESEEVQSFELFVDLLYVGIIAVNGDTASERATGTSLLRFVITFTLSWKIWNDMVLIISWFETDDMFQRLSILFLLACLFGFTTNITQAFDYTYPTLIGFYLASRLYMAGYLLAISFLLPMIRAIMLWHVAVTLVGAALWIASIHVAWPARLVAIWIAIFIDICGQSLYVLVMMLCLHLGGRAQAWFDRCFEYSPAINIEHRTERMNAFVTLVFGYSVVAILYQSTINGIDAFFGKAILGLIQCFCFNWIYFEIDGSNLHTHAIRRAKFSAMTWSMSHLPFIMAFVLGGGAWPVFEAEILPGIRWFYCTGFGVALACMGVISLSHVHKEIEGLRLRKRWRLVSRFSVAAVLVFLPLATVLDSLDLVAVVTCLVCFTLGVELWASSCCYEKLTQRSTPCRYVGRCGRREIEALIRNGEAIDVEGLNVEKARHDGVVFGP
ncbi:hypothetical protein M433DRAFT_146436 [Acidomyces richmondensis BFW]|nr:hypothetical protein M433DRAFT_146436 [Acidomyces richmondensis BFW]